jgi:hypothetical protein
MTDTPTAAPEQPQDEADPPFDPKRAAEILRRARGRGPYRARGSACTVLSEMTDQRTPEDCENPYWDFLLTLPGREHMDQLVVEIPVWTDDGALTLELMRAGVHHDPIRMHYAWSIPTPGDLDMITGWLEPGQGVVEVCAGSGYWAWMLTQYGVDTVAYDQAPGGPGSGNRFAKGGPWHPVLVGGPQSAAEHPDRALLLCWPPQDSPVAAQTLAAYRGDTLVLAMNYGASGDADFHAALRRDWDRVDESGAHVSIIGMEDSVLVLRRRDTPRPASQDREPSGTLREQLDEIMLRPFTQAADLADLLDLLDRMDDEPDPGGGE